MVTLHVGSNTRNGNPQVPPFAKQDLSPAELPGELNDVKELSISVILEYNKRVEQRVLC